jgi:hypothetical protein
MTENAPITENEIAAGMTPTEIAFRRRVTAIGHDADTLLKDQWKTRIDAIHVHVESWTDAKKKFDRLIKRTASKSLPGKCVVVSGPSGAGKSHIIKRLLKRPELQPSVDQYGPLRPLVYVETPSGCSSKELASRIFKALSGKSLSGKLTATQAWEAASTLALGMGTSIIVIDEFHHVFGLKDYAKRMQIVNDMKILVLPNLDEKQSNQVKLPMQLVVGGLPVVADVVLADTQMAERHEAITIRPLPRSKEGLATMQKFLSLVESKLEFPLPCNLATTDATLRFMKASARYTGRAMRFIKDAVNIAIDEGRSNIGMEDLGRVLQDAYNLPPEKNPFLVPDISKCAVVNPKYFDDLSLLKGTKRREDDEEEGDA